jgi:Flp pilus assembly protein TadG
MGYGRSPRRSSDDVRRGTARRRRRGAVLVMTALTMTGLMIATAFAVDLGRLYVLRSELQTAADAAALAAAVRLNGDWNQAEQTARATAKANGTLDGDADVDAVRFGVWDPDARQFEPGTALGAADAAHVVVGRKTSSMFSRLVSKDSLRITARATAWAGAPAFGSDCVKPWFILHHDFMAAISEPHRNLTTADVRKVRDTAAVKRELKIRLRHNTNVKPVPGIFYGMQLPTPYSGETPKKMPTFHENATGCNRMEQGWVAKTEASNTAANSSWTGFKELCRPLDPTDGTCYNSDGRVGVPITVSIFCTGDEHTGGEMWFQVEWMTGLMIKRVEKDGSDLILTGYLIPVTGTGVIKDDRKATGLVRTILVR